MTGPGLILVVDDVPRNVKLLVDLLDVHGYQTLSAESGAEALELVASHNPDLILLDVMMPGMNGYDVCAKLRADDRTALLPIVMVTALDPTEERITGIEAGADDFLSKPVNTQELLARVRSLLRIKHLNDTVRDQAVELSRWNHELEERVATQVKELSTLDRLKRFLPHQLAELLANEHTDRLAPHRREISVVFIDIRGFTPFAESAEPEEVMDVLADYHQSMGEIIKAHDGTVERFLGDGIMIVFNDPVETEDAEEKAAKMAVGMRDAGIKLRERWLRVGHDIDIGIGAAVGYATIGMIGFEGRRDYSAIGSVCNLAARLCADAAGGQVLVSERFFHRIESVIEAESLGELNLKGFRRPVTAYNVLSVPDPEQ